MIYVGVPEKNATAALRKRIQDCKLGKSGYVYVLSGDPATRGQYVVSKGGARDGENILDTTDADGNKVIRDIIAKAETLGPAESAEHRYRWKNADDPGPRWKTVSLVHFKPWNWVIGASMTDDEFTEAARQIEAVAVQGRKVQAGVAAGAIIMAAAMAWVVSGRISSQIQQIAHQLLEGSEQVRQASDQIANAGQQVAESATTQAAASEETTSSIEEMRVQSKQTSQFTNGARELMDENIRKSGDSLKAMVEMTRKMGEIREDSAKMKGIVNSITEIAFQTNLLALNAAVEAARAGEHGRGFAVVAEEVRNLATRSAEAAKNTQSLLESTVQRVAATADSLQGINDNFEGIVESATLMGEKLDQITEGSKQMLIGMDQIATAAGNSSTTAQSNAANAEESAAAAEELSSQANCMTQLVGQLRETIEGSSGRRKVAV
jgi:methyl-accepting chemotaxis protein